MTDKGVSKAELIDKVRPHLEKQGLNITVYDELTTEPSMDSMSTCAKFARDGKYNPRRLTLENITDFMYKMYDGRILE